MSARLSNALLAHLPMDVQRPAYDRAALQPGMAHIGVGAFHRTHQAEYTDDLLHHSLTAGASSAPTSAILSLPGRSALRVASIRGSSARTTGSKHA
jgi:mannitol-1-phosphate/altronate dehydrogenase